MIRTAHTRRLALATVAALILTAVVQPHMTAAQNGEGVRRFGVFVGANDGGTSRVRLRYAVTDAERMADVMYRVGGVSPRDGVVLTDPDPQEIGTTLNRVRGAMDRARDGARRVELVFYYSGHSNEQGLLLGDAMLPYRELRQSIEGVEADVAVALLDSCSSGSFTRLKGGRRTQPFLFDDGAEMTGYAFLTSSSDDEASQESDEIGASFFTHYVVSGLLGAADSTGDRRVTLNEVYQYAFAETLSRTSSTFAGPQHPSYEIQLTGAGDLVLTDLTTRTAGVRIGADIAGRMWVRDAENGRLVAEFEKYRGQELAVNLAPGAYRVDVRLGEDLKSTEIVVLSGTETRVDRTQFDAVALEWNRARGDKAVGDSASDDDTFDDIRKRAHDAIATMESATRGALGEPSDTAAAVHTRPPYRDLAYEPVVLDLVPGVRFYPNPSVREGSSVHHAVFGLVAAEAGHTDGVMASLGMNVGTGVTRGVETSTIGNVREGRIEGVQSSSIFNILHGDVYGVQASSVFNVTDGNVRGIQASSVFNILDGSVYGVQSAGVFNAAGGSVAGVQASGIVSVAESVTGVQTAAVTMAEDVVGLQAGLLNVGESVRGMQVGVVNIAEEVDGVTLGLLNIVRFGVLDFSVVFDDRGMTRFGLQHGTQHLYTMYEVGLRQQDLEAGDAVVEAAVGLGTRIWDGFFYLDADIMAKSITGEREFDEVYPSMRLSGGIQFSRRFALVAGVTLDSRLDFANQEGADMHSGDSFTIFGEGVRVYPHYFAGVRL